MIGVRLASPAEYRALPLHAHALLADVPLHDVWAVELPGGGDGRSLQEALVPLRNGEAVRGHPFVRGLFALRTALGRLFGWDSSATAPAPTREPPASRVRAALPSDLVAASEPRSGSVEGPFTILYGTQREMVGEIRNATVHAFSVHALVEEADGYRLYWGIYVEPVSALTPFYMALIAPFRRFIVYPAILGEIRKGWLDGPGKVPRSG